MRINKFLAEKGIASRRHADKMIEDGRVTINGVLAALGATVEEGDVVCVDDISLSMEEKKEEYYIMNKPKGVICTVSDDRGRKTVMDLLPNNVGRVFPVGRLDYETEGLLIFTNDGDLAFRLTHPSSEIPKTYMAKIEGTLTEKDLNPLRSGVELDGVMTKKCKAHIVETHKDYTKVHITITEGKNRQVRRMFEAIGKNVELLRRVSIGQLKLKGLNRGEIRPLTSFEIEYLKGL
jgi:23S rRNA pseudouridine2605 synthase